MVVYNNFITFSILGEDINLSSEDTSYGRSTVAELDDNYYYLDDMFPGIEAAIVVWETATNLILSTEQINQVMKDNNPNL